MRKMILVGGGQVWQVGQGGQGDDIGNVAISGHAQAVTDALL